MSRRSRAREVARMVSEAAAPPVDGDICALVVPHTCDAGGGALTARLVKAVAGSPIRTVIVMASGSLEAAGRIHVSRNHGQVGLAQIAWDHPEGDVQRAIGPALGKGRAPPPEPGPRVRVELALEPLAQQRGDRRAHGADRAPPPSECGNRGRV